MLRQEAHELTALLKSCGRCVLVWLRAALARFAMVTVLAACCEGVRGVQAGEASVDSVCVRGLPFSWPGSGRFVRAL